MNPAVHFFGKQAHAACVLTDRFLSGFAGRVQTATEFPTDADEPGTIRLATVRGYFSRTLGWLSSVSKLNDSSDVQAVTVAARSLFEALVDLVLLHLGKTEQTFEKVFAWERSATLKHAERVVRFYAGKTLPLENQSIPTFLAGPEPAQIRAARVKWWGTEKHPRNRWTGNDLGVDAERAQA